MQRTFFAAFTVLGLLSSCAQMDRYDQMDMTQVVQSAKTSTDHETLARHYGNMAKTMQEKMQEHKKMLEQYEANSYGRETDEMKGHTQALIRFYENAEKENMRLAALHRKMAAEAK
jgi:hypothetical protein